VQGRKARATKTQDLSSFDNQLAPKTSDNRARSSGHIDNIFCTEVCRDCQPIRNHKSGGTPCPPQIGNYLSGKIERSERRRRPLTRRGLEKAANGPTKRSCCGRRSSMVIWQRHSELAERQYSEFASNLEITNGLMKSGGNCRSVSSSAIIRRGFHRR